MPGVSNSIIIAFIRDLKNHAKDDSLSIVPCKVTDRMFKLVYRDMNNHIRTESICSEHDIYNYLENVFSLLNVDQDPFNYVQITPPGFPPVMLKTTSLTDYSVRDAVTSVVKNTLRNWPAATSLIENVEAQYFPAPSRAHAGTSPDFSPPSRAHAGTPGPVIRPVTRSMTGSSTQ